jgi:hypothetical protein
LEIAAIVKGSETQAVLLLMAQVWLRLANEHAIAKDSSPRFSDVLLGARGAAISSE